MQGENNKNLPLTVWQIARSLTFSCVNVQIRKVNNTTVLKLKVVNSHC